MDDIIKELATVEKLTSNNTMIYKEQTNFFKIYTKTLDIMMVNPENIAAKLEILKFEADVGMMSIALKNLIDNGIKFSQNKKAIINANKE